jgi:hypothetical protein
MPAGDSILQKLQAGGGTQLVGLLSEVERFLSPLSAGLAEGEVASLSAAKKYATWLVQFMKSAFDLLGSSMPGQRQEVLVSCACLAVDRIRTARLAIKGRPLEIELQIYSLVRKLVAIGQYRIAAKYGRALYISVCSHCGSNVSSVGAFAESAEWPPPPQPSRECDQQAPGLLVCALLNALLCAAEAPTAPEALRRLRQTVPALSGIGAWLRWDPGNLFVAGKTQESSSRN